MPLMRLGASGGILGASDGALLKVGNPGFRRLLRPFPVTLPRALDSGLWVALDGPLGFLEAVAGRDRTVRELLDGKAGFRLALNRFRILQDKPTLVGGDGPKRDPQGRRGGTRPWCLVRRL
jgi:hypothetical protein